MSVDLNLPDLELGVDAAIVQENLHAVQAIYFAYALEELRLDEVVERIAALFQQGLLPLGKGAAAQALIDEAANRDRLSDNERADLYARAFGVPGGEATGPQVNRAFDELWLRFVSSVSAFVRQNDVETLLRPASASNTHVRCAARDLALNLSKHAFGLNALAARLERSRGAQLALLGEPDIQRAFGANDVWDLVERVNRDYLGGPVNALRARTRAHSGATILGWLADRADTRVRGPAGVPTSTPTNSDLANSAEAWLAATGVSDEAVEHYAQPMESPPTERPPGKLPALAEGLLEELGLRAGAAAGEVGGECAAGFSALFRGAPGTGKTLAAQALASALSRELVRVDLSQVVATSIGETEKNLDAVFERAGISGAILLFDEADALLGKRSAIKDAHDRYANIDIAYLLQRIEAHRARGGSVIIESRHDDAAIHGDVLDRLRAVVRFPRRARP